MDSDDWSPLTGVMDQGRLPGTALMVRMAAVWSARSRSRSNVRALDGRC